MNFSPYSNLNDKAHNDTTSSTSTSTKRHFKIYQIKKTNSNNTNTNSSPRDAEMEMNNFNDNKTRNIEITQNVNADNCGCFSSDSQFMQSESSYTSLFNYEQKANVKRSDSLISLSSQVDLATIENNKINELDSSSYSEVVKPKVLKNNNTSGLSREGNNSLILTHKKSNSAPYATNHITLNILNKPLNLDQYNNNYEQHCQQTLLPDVYSKKNQTNPATNKPKTTKLKSFFTEKVFNSGNNSSSISSSGIKYKVKSSSSSSIHLIEEFQKPLTSNNNYNTTSNSNKHMVKTLSSKGTDLLVNNFNRISNKIV